MIYIILYNSLYVCDIIPVLNIYIYTKNQCDILLICTTR